MRKIVLRFGLLSGLMLLSMSAIMLPLCLNGTLPMDSQQTLGYTTMVLAFLFVFFGVRSYRETVGGGAITFGKAFQVGILISLVTCAMYVIAWEITYFNFMPDFLDKFTAHALAQMKASGESPAEIQKKTEQMAFMAKYYKNPLFNSAITFIEIFPVGLIVTLVTAAILRRKVGPGTQGTPVPA